MFYFVVTVVAISLFLTAMAVGVLLGQKPLKGSCGGLNMVMGNDEECQFCGKKEDCEKRLKALAEEAKAKS